MRKRDEEQQRRFVLLLYYTLKEKIENKARSRRENLYYVRIRCYLEMNKKQDKEQQRGFVVIFVRV